jgi:hypothetical protein
MKDEFKLIFNWLIFQYFSLLIFEWNESWKKKLIINKNSLKINKNLYIRIFKF